MKFVDEVSFVVASGAGGAGAMTFLREKFIPRGGPDGGDGGRGGAVIFEATRSRNTLVDFRFNKVYRGEDGQKGGRKKMTGRSGQDLTLLVPVGTVVTEAATGEVLADLADAGSTWRLEGGRGGKGNRHFATATHRTPRFAQEGEAGTEIKVKLELRLLADVGLLGFPNAGKSTLISRISAARPKIADYPFTTLVPNLGVVNVGEGSSFVVADIPGLIEGASGGAGLGHQFLRHLTRCKLILHLVSAEDDAGDPAERVHTLRNELRAYSEPLAERHEIVVLTKCDLLTDEQRADALHRLRGAGIDAHPISSVAGIGLQQLVHLLWSELQSTSPPEAAQEPS